MNSILGSVVPLAMFIGCLPRSVLPLMFIQEPQKENSNWQFVLFLKAIIQPKTSNASRDNSFCQSSQFVLLRAIISVLHCIHSRRSVLRYNSPDYYHYSSAVQILCPHEPQTADNDTDFYLSCPVPILCLQSTKEKRDHHLC